LIAQLFDYLNSYIYYYPAFAFVALILAGFNIPFSEDLIIITGALVSQKDEKTLIPCIVLIYLGVYLSDIIAYYLGAFVARGKLKMKFIRRILNHRYTKRLVRYVERFGIFTFILCRFMPFGVRPALFLTSGFTGLKLKRFLLFDLVASIISVNTLFWLVYYFGESAEKPLHVIGVILFIILAVVIITLIIRLMAKFIKRKNSEC